MIFFFFFPRKHLTFHVEQEANSEDSDQSNAIMQSVQDISRVKSTGRN